MSECNTLIHPACILHIVVTAFTQAPLSQGKGVQGAEQYHLLAVLRSMREPHYSTKAVLTRLCPDQASQYDVEDLPKMSYTSNLKHACIFFISEK